MNATETQATTPQPQKEPALNYRLLSRPALVFLINHAVETIVAILKKRNTGKVLMHKKNP
jgi:hypothetical protein